MLKAISGQKLAVLVASGFNEKDLIETQKNLLKSNMKIQVIGLDQGLVGSWAEQGWGLNFPADAVLNAALAADYDALMIPGGQRSVDKLKMTAHTRRFIRGFIDESKPVVVFDEAAALIAFAERADARVLSGPQEVLQAVAQAGGTASPDPVTEDSCLISGDTSRVSKGEFVAQALRFVMEHLAQAPALNKAA